MPDFLGYNSIFQDWVTYEEAKKYIKNFNITSTTEYKKKWDENLFKIKVPKNPRSVYKNKGFISMPDFLGYDSMFQNWKNWDESIKIIHPLKLKTAKAFRTHIKENPIKGLHSSPESYFRDIWKEKGSWSGFLGKPLSPQEKARYRMPFEKAREYVWMLKFKTGDEWKAFIKSSKFPVFFTEKPSNYLQGMDKY
jgi:hypothetical protein